MGALLKQAVALLAGNMAGSNNKATFIVKGLRTVYILNGTAIAVIWYSAYRNERVKPGEAKFPFPGVTNLKRQFSPDRPEYEASNSGVNNPGGGPEKAGRKTGKTVSLVGPLNLNNVIGWCNKVSGKYPYVWGGGHAQIGIPSGGGFDCSGAVSGAIGQLGSNVLAQPLTSWQFAEVFPHGEGKWITIYGNEKHCFMKININGTWIWFGTGSDKEAFRGGVAWGNHDPDLSAYTACHPVGY